MNDAKKLSPKELRMLDASPFEYALLTANGFKPIVMWEQTKSEGYPPALYKHQALASCTTSMGPPLRRGRPFSKSQSDSDMERLVASFVGARLAPERVEVLGLRLSRKFAIERRSRRALERGVPLARRSFFLEFALSQIANARRALLASAHSGLTDEQRAAWLSLACEYFLLAEDNRRRAKEKGP
jgi:hypothetical protein